MPGKIKRLRPVREGSGDYDAIARHLLKVLRDEIFLPIVAALKLKPKYVLQNAAFDPLRPLYDALASGKVRYHRGVFIGKLNAATVKALRSLGATYDKTIKGYRISANQLTPSMRQAIGVSEMAFTKTLLDVDKRLAQILPADIADQVNISSMVSKLLWKTDRDLATTLKDLTVSPTLDPKTRRYLADQWQNNMQLEIKKFTAEATASLRKLVEKSTFAGNRLDAITKGIEAEYGVTASKAKFLARQETHLLLTKYKESRYNAAGVHEYEWRCVAGSPNHPVRASHKALEGSIQRFDAPPVTTMPGETLRRNNPGQDFGCRCFALPIVRF